MRTEEELNMWRGRARLAQAGLESVRRELGIGPDESIIGAIRRLRQAQQLASAGSAAVREEQGA